MFLNPNNFFQFQILIETSRNKLKKHSVTKNCSDLLLFEKIVQVISKFLQILGPQPRISKVFLITIFSHSRSEQFCQQNTISSILTYQANFLGCQHKISGMTFDVKSSLVCFCFVLFYFLCLQIFVLDPYWSKECFLFTHQ